MGLFEIFLIGVGLSMDAVAVSMTNGMVYQCVSTKKLLAMPLFFGLFQALMPLLGFFAGSFFAFFIRKYSGIVILAILGMIGAKMVKDGFCHNAEERCITKVFTYKILFLQAVVTSIDAFAVGVGFAARGTDILFAVGVIGLITLLLSFLAILIGKRFGDLLGAKAEIVGGIILIAIGIKAVLPL